MDINTVVVVVPVVLPEISKLLPETTGVTTLAVTLAPSTVQAMLWEEVGVGVTVSFLEQAASVVSANTVVATRRKRKWNNIA